MRIRPGNGLYLSLFNVLSVLSISSVATRAENSTQPPQSYEFPRSLNAEIYTGDRKELLFKFSRAAEVSGSRLKVERLFSYPDGKLAARESVVYDKNALVSFELEDAQTGAKGSATIRRPTNATAKAELQIRYAKADGGRPKVRTETLRENTLVADMVGTFLTSNWDALKRGEKVKCRLIVTSRVETVGFTFERDSEAKLNGNEVLLVKMEPGSPIISALIHPLWFTMEQMPPHRVLEYQGRTTPKFQVDGKWKDLEALTVFDWKTAK